MFRLFLSDQYLNIQQTGLHQIVSVGRTVCQVIDLKLAFRSLNKRYHGNQFLALSTQLSFGDIRLMALAYGERG